MSMLISVSGTFNLTALNVPTLTNLDEIIIRCDTSIAPVVVNLAKISSFGGQVSFRIKVVDASGNASNNPITINTAGGIPPDTFVGGASSFIINGNNGCVEIVMVGLNSWAIFNAGVSQSSNVYSGQAILDNPTLLTLDTVAFKLISGITDKVIQVTSFVSQLDFGVVYSMAGGNDIEFFYDTTVTNQAIPRELIVGTQDKIADNSLQGIQCITALNNLSDYKGKDVNLKATSAITGGSLASIIIIDYQYRIINAI